MKFKAIIHDMDGLLIDSMIYWINNDNKFFAERGSELTPDLIKEVTGKSIEQSVVLLKEKLGWLESVEDLLRIRTGLARKVYTDYTLPMPGAKSLLEFVAASQMKQAIGSGASMDWINITVDRFGWRDHFDELISVEHVNHRGKPEPDVYLHVADVLGVKPEECLVFEDAENGVVSAKRAGMKCIAVPDERWSYGDFSQADLRVDSLEDKKIFDYLNL